MMIVAHSCILFLVIFFNACGVFCLMTLNKDGICNQVMILISHSTCNILLAIFWIGDMLFAHMNAVKTIWYYRWWPFLASIYLVWYLMIFLLTVDRFIGCNFPIRHKIFIRKRFILAAIGVCWSIGLTLAVIGSFVGSESLRPTVRKYGWPTLDILFLFLFVLTYGSIFFVIARRRFNVQTSRTSHQSQFILTVTALLTSFLMLEAIPSLVNAFLKRPHVTFEKILLTLYKVNLLCDPLIYIFLQRKVRNIAKTKLHSFSTVIFWSKFNQVYDMGGEIGSNSVTEEPYSKQVV